MNLIDTDIMNLSASLMEFQAGENLYNKGAVFDITYKEHENGNLEIEARIVEDSKVLTKVIAVTLIFKQRKSLSYRKCDCTSNSIWRGCCKHAVAAMLAFQNMSTDAKEFQKSTDLAKNLVSKFEDLAMREINNEFAAANDENKVQLRPIFHIEKNKPHLTFIIGREKYYIMKDIERFLENLEFENEESYGKKLTFVHRNSAFEQRSLALIKFIKAYGHRSRSTYINAFSFEEGVSRNIKNLLLTEKAIDDFFEIYEDEYIDIMLDEKKYNVLLLDELPNVKFIPEIIEGGISLSCKIGEYFFMTGYEYRYFICADGFFRIDANFFEVLSNILSVMKQSSQRRVIFTENEVKKFMLFLLPKLKALNLIEDCNEFEEKFQEDTLFTKIYVDAKKDMLISKAQFCYGEEIFTPFTEITEEVRVAVLEYKIDRLLMKWGFEKNTELHQFELFDDEKIYDFCFYGIQELKKYAELYISNEFKRKSISAENQTKFGVRLTGNLLEISFDTSEFSTQELLAIMNSYNHKKRYHKLKDGRFYNLEDEKMRSTIEVLSELNLSNKEIVNSSAVLPKYRAVYLNDILQDKEIMFEQDKSFKKLTNDFKNFEHLEFPIPNSLESTLRTYQKVGFNWLKVLAHYGFGGILADDMGLGKTLQVIAILLSEKEERTLPSIVVAPTSLVYNWQSEINKFAKGLKTEALVGLPSKRKELLNEMKENKIDVYITTYDTLKRDIAQYEGKTFRYIIADEAQNIKNPSTQNSKAIKRLAGEVCIALTGTPIENSISELWSIFDFIMPNYLYSHSKFVTHYETPIVKNEDKQKIRELKKQIAPFILRRLKKDVLTELPDKTETTLFAEMFEEQRKMYTAHLLQAKEEFEGYIQANTYSSNQLKILSLLTRMRQICCDPSLFIENYSKGSGKLELAIETIQAAIESNHRILLFSQFTSMLSIIKDRLEKENISYFYLDGSTTAKERLEMSNRFNQGEKEVFLISLKAGGTGLNLIGADMVIHYDPWWNPAVMEQASDRAYRFGQLNKVQVYNLVAKDTIEEKIMQLQEKKKNLVDNVITEGSNFITKMSKEDIAELFNSF